MPQEELVWKLLLLRERLLVWALLRLGERKSRRRGTEDRDLGRLLRGRVARLLAGDWAALLDESRASGAALAASREGTLSEYKDESYLADEVLRKALSEEYSRAAALLASPGLAPLSQDTADSLQTLLQPRACVPLVPPARRGQTRPPFEATLFRQILRRTPKGSGAAVGGGRWEHWRVVLASPAALDALYEVACRVASGDVPECAAEVLAVSKLTALNKPGGGVRPIAAPSLLRRLAGRALCGTWKKEVAAALGRHQFAVGVPAGAESLAHTARTLTEADADLVLLALDAQNAFCSADRNECLRELERNAPEFIACADMFSRRTSQYFFWDARGHCHRLTSTGGVDQGDPLAPLLFAFGLKPHLAKLEEDLRARARELGLDPNRVHLLAYLDDIIVLVPSELAMEALTAAAAAFGGFGLQLRMDKTQAWSRGATCPAGLEPHWRCDGVTLVGVPLGEPVPPSGMPDDRDDFRVDLGNTDYVLQRCNATADRAAVFLRKVAELPTLASPHLPAVQLSALLLRMCGGGKITHLLRSTPPGSVREATACFDQAMLDSYAELAALDALSSMEVMQCQLPLRDGGRGLRSQERLAPAAWLASWAQCLSQVVMRTNLEELVDLETCTLPLAQHCRDALACMPPADSSELSGGSADVLDWNNWVLELQKKLQKVLSKRIDKKLHTALLRSLDASSKARLFSCAGPLASAWQWASPGNIGESMDDSDYRSTARELLGQPMALVGSICQNRARSGPSANQPCGEALCPYARHAHKCSNGGGLKARSVDIENVMDSILGECGYTVARQAHVLQWSRWKWHCSSCSRRGLSWDLPRAPCDACGDPVVSELEEAILDIDARSARVPRLLLDVTVRFGVPGGIAQLAAAARGPGAVNRTAEAEKRLRYPDGRSPWSMVPVAIETFGRIGISALKLLRGLARARAQEIDRDGQAVVSALLQRWGARISVALHRSNALRLRSSLGCAEPARLRALALAADLAG